MDSKKSAVSGDGPDSLADQLFCRGQERLKGWILYTSDAADDLLCVNLGGGRIIKKKRTKKKKKKNNTSTTQHAASLYTHSVSFST